MVKNQHEHTVSIVEMKMLCWMCDKIRRDRTKNDDTGEKVGVRSTCSRKVGINLT